MSKLEVKTDDKPMDRLESPEPTANSSSSSARSGGEQHRDLTDKIKKVDDLQSFIRQEDKKLNKQLPQFDEGIHRDEDYPYRYNNYNYEEGMEGEDEYEKDFAIYGDYGYSHGIAEMINNDVEPEENDFPYQKHQNKNPDKSLADENLVIEDFDSSANLNASDSLAKTMAQSKQKVMQSEEQSSEKNQSILTSIMNSVRNVFGNKKVDTIDNNLKKKPIRMNAFEESQQKSSSFCCF